MAFVNFYSAFASIISVPVILGSLGANIYGQYAFVFIQCQLLILIINYSFDLYAVSKVNKNNENNPAQMLFEILVARLMLMMLFGSILYCYFSLRDDVDLNIVYILLLSVLPICFNLSWYFKIHEEMHKLGISIFFSKTVYILLVLFPYKLNIEFFCYAFLASNLLMIFVQWLYISICDYSFDKGIFSRAIYLIRDGWGIFFYQLTVGALPTIFTNFAMSFGGATLVTLLDLFNKLTSVMNMLFLSIIEGIYPRIAATGLAQQIRMFFIFCTLVLIYLLCGFLCIYLFNNELTSLLNTILKVNFKEFTNVLIISLLFVTTCSINAIVSRVLLVHNSLRVIQISTLCSLACSLILTPFVISNLGDIGLFIGMLISQVVLMQIMIWFLFRKVFYK